MSALWTPQALLEATGGMLRVPFSANGVSIDSRSVRPGQLFVALVGENGDGHAHVAAALAAGAAGAMVHALPDDLADDAKLLVVPDTFVALHALGRFARYRFAGRLVAVTGSVGKTTTKEMLRAILTAQGKCWAAEASHNNHWGVPLTLARLPAQHGFGVVEIGMNHAGEIAPLSRLARPHVALITTIAPAHIGQLGSLAAIAAEKLSIAEGLEPEGLLIVPEDLQTPAGLVVERFGHGAEADHRLISATPNASGSDVVAEIAGQPLSFRLGAPGRHMAMNAVAALAAAHALGADAAIGAQALTDFAPGAGRGAQRMLPIAGGSVTLLDESYNASAIAVRAALDVLSLIPAMRRIAVLGDMLELGNSAVAEHAGLVDDIAERADLVFTCGNQMQAVHAALPARLRGTHAADSATLAPLVQASLRPGDAVLVKGSLGMRMKTIVTAIEAAAAKEEG